MGQQGQEGPKTLKEWNHSDLLDASSKLSSLMNSKEIQLTLYIKHLHYG